MKVLRSRADIHGAVGEELGPSDWLTITQDRVDAFAEVTGDHQWIHVDTERAAAGPFGHTVAHGYLTLALIPLLATELLTYETGSARLNYGLNRVRFPRPVPVGSRIRGRAVILEITDVPAGTQVVTRFTIEIEGVDKPACVAEAVTHLRG
ncbi:MAG: MaoC family dehydratase [Nocardioidaceae bacterium]